MKKFQLLGITISLLFMMSCFDDKGNYVYDSINNLTIEVPDEISVLANADTIKVFPNIVSDLEGEILPDNINYTYKYVAAKENAGNSLGALFVLDSTFSRNLIIPTKLEEGNYKCWLEVEDLRTGVVSLADFSLHVSLATTEGWVVLSEKGDNERVQLDMIARISDERSIQTYDLLANYLSDLHKAHSLSFFGDGYGIDSWIYMFTGDGGFKLDITHLTSAPEYSIDYEFAKQDKKRIPFGLKTTAYYRLIVDQNYDAYAMENSDGSIYEFPVNCEENGEVFRVAPYIGTDMNKSGNICNSAILYDMDNQRFVQWTEDYLNSCYPLNTPESPLFSYSTGKELVYMESTLKSNTIVYSILKDKNGKFFLYGISMKYNQMTWSTTYSQEYFDEIHAENIDKATAFAFHSKLPYLFYSVKNQLYLYNYYDKQSYHMFDLPNEEITLLKFNLLSKVYSFVQPSQYVQNLPNLLVIGSNETGTDNGILRFYEAQELNKEPILVEGPYHGFGKIKDVVYKEN